jgi:hypothetical protein
VGTVVVTCVSELTVNAAVFPPRVTFVVWVRLTPVIVTTVPAGPLVGVKLFISGLTLNILLLCKLPVEVVMVTRPVVAPVGTTAVKYVPDFTLGVAGVPLKETVVDDVKPCPRNSTVFPTLLVDYDLSRSQHD